MQGCNLIPRVLVDLSEALDAGLRRRVVADGCRSSSHTRAHQEVLAARSKAQVPAENVGEVWELYLA